MHEWTRNILARGDRKKSKQTNTPLPVKVTLQLFYSSWNNKYPGKNKFVKKCKYRWVIIG